MTGRKQETVSGSEVGNIVGLCQEATTEEWAGGLVWYAAYGAAIRDYGVARGMDGASSLALFATLSPQARIARNWANFKAVVSDRSIKNAKCLFPHVKAKALGLVDGSMNVETATKGDKVSAFYANLSGDYSRVTIDRHAIAAALGYCPESNRVDSAQYRHYELAYQAAAQLLGVQPAQAQAIAWIVWRRKKGIIDDGGLSLIA